MPPINRYASQTRVLCRVTLQIRRSTPQHAVLARCAAHIVDCRQVPPLTVTY
jgi:hypothetical protein